MRTFEVVERFIAALEDSDDAAEPESPTFEVSSPRPALVAYVRATGARLLGATDHPDGTIGATAWRGDCLHRIRVSERSAAEVTSTMRSDSNLLAL